MTGREILDASAVLGDALAATPPLWGGRWRSTGYPRPDTSKGVWWC